MKLSTSDYKKILKFYKLSIPKKSKNIKKKADKIIAKKFCSCIKKVQKKFKKEGIAIGICTKSVITRKGYKRGKFRCKKRRTIKLQKGGRKKTRKKRGAAPKFLCGPDIDFVPEVHFNELESIFDKLKEDTTDTAYEKIVDELPSIRRDKKSGKCIGCKKLIDELVKNTMPSFVGGKILPIKNDDIIWLQQFTGVHKGGMCTIMGGRRKKKTRKKRGGVVRGWWGDITLNDIKLGEKYRVTTTNYRQVIPQPFIGTYRGVRQNSSMQNIYTFFTETFSHTGLGETDIPFPESTIQRVEQYNIAPDGNADMAEYINKFKGGRKKKSRKKRGGTANLCKLFFEQNNGNVPIDTDHTVIDKYCKDHGDTNIPPNTRNICQATTGNCWLPTNIQPRQRLIRVNRRGNNQGSRRSSIASTSLAPGRLTRQQGGGSKKDINQERFKLIKMEAKKLLDNNKEIIKKIEKKHNIKILKNSKAIKKILDKTTLKDILKFKEKLMKIQKGGTREDEEDVSCAICLEDFTNERRSIPREEWRFPCNHYRNHCIDCLPQFAFSGFDPNKIDTCPICRAPLITTFMERRNRDIQTLYDNIYLSDVVFVIIYGVITYLNHTGGDDFPSTFSRSLWQIFFTGMFMFMAGSVRHNQEIWRRRGERRRQAIEAINNNPQLNELLLQGRDADAERARDMLINYANQEQQEGGKRRRKTRRKRGGCKWDKIKGWFNCGTRKKSYIKTIKIPRVSRKKINNTKRNSPFYVDEDEEEDDDTKNLKFMEAGIDGFNTEEDWARGPTDIDTNNDIPIINKDKQDGGNKYF